jgi:hypothetical protein
MIACEKLFVGLHHAFGRVQKAFTTRVLASPAQKGTYSVLSLAPAWPFDGIFANTRLD